LGRALRERGYRFVTPTPATHAIVNARQEGAHATSLIDVFGWSRPFGAGVLPSEIADLAATAGIVEETKRGSRSTVRFSSLDGLLFMHSAFPTTQSDAVFFGPDTYRFARALKSAAEMPCPRAVRVVDIGCGSGAGGIYLSHLLEDRSDVDLVLGDINPQALRFARINAALNERSAEVVHSNVLHGIEGAADLIVANPPYLIDGAKRAYRHGGGDYGGALSLRIVQDSIPRLARGGRLVLYTGSAIVNGVDTFWRDVHPLLTRAALPVAYEEIDADVFGEELHEAPYHNADRIAVVVLTIRKE
jgi:SAM-dependent methyltransferase